MSAKTRYELMKSDREPFLDRARHNALLTIPSLMPLEGEGGESHKYEAYQSKGAEGVVTLSGVLAGAFLPDGQNVARLEPPPEFKAAQKGKIDESITDGLAASEALIQQEIDILNWRETIHQELQQLIIAGNCVKNILPDNNLRIVRLDQYTNHLDYSGRLLELVIEEPMAIAALPDEARHLATQGARTGSIMDRTRTALRFSLGMAQKEQEEVRLYTWIRIENRNGRRMYRHRQEVNDQLVPDSEGFFDLERLPYAVLRWDHTPGEQYGRSKVEEHSGALRSLEGLQKALLEGAALTARHIIMVRKELARLGLDKQIAKASNGDVLVGDPDGTKLLTYSNPQALQTIQQFAELLASDIERSFFMRRGARRQADRVTAREISGDEDEIDDVLGGQVANLSRRSMLWSVDLLMLQMTAQSKLPDVLTAGVRPQLLSGRAALSRARRSRILREDFELIGKVPQLGQNIDMNKAAKEYLIGRGLPDMTLSKEEVQQNQQKAQEQAMLQKAAGPVAGALAKPQQ